MLINYFVNSHSSVAFVNNIPVRTYYSRARTLIRINDNFYSYRVTVTVKII